MKDITVTKRIVEYLLNGKTVTYCQRKCYRGYEFVCNIKENLKKILDMITQNKSIDEIKNAFQNIDETYFKEYLKALEKHNVIRFNTYIKDENILNEIKNTTKIFK